MARRETTLLNCIILPLALRRDPLGPRYVTVRFIRFLGDHLPPCIYLRSQPAVKMFILAAKRQFGVEIFMIAALQGPLGSVGEKQPAHPGT